MKNFFYGFIVTQFLTLPLFVFGQGLSYKSLVTLPGGFNTETSSLSDLFQNLYLLSISIAALLAVFKIIIAGVKWMLTDIVPARSKAKSDIQGALLGLILIISAVLILNVINPTIVGKG